MNIFHLLSTKIPMALQELRRNLGILTADEAQLAYVASAQDRIDLEMRIRELDHSRRTVASHPGTNWSL